MNTIVFIDDVVGTGNRVGDSWSAQFGELLAEVGRVYFVVVAGYTSGVNRIAIETDWELVDHFHLNESENVFATLCQFFNRTEKTIFFNDGSGDKTPFFSPDINVTDDSESIKIMEPGE